MRYDHLRLDNGLELVGEYSPDALSMAGGFFCRTGARDETPAESGVSHFLEHMMFKGTETLDYDAINKTFDRLGAQYNAFTSEENTVYYGQVLPEFQGELLALLAQMMRPALRGGDFDMEKKVILEEIAMYDDRPLWVAHDHCRRLHYGTHALGNSVLGTAASIGDLRCEQMLDYFGRRYAADNLTFAISGRYDWSAAVDTVSRFAAAWQPSSATRQLGTPDFGSGVQTIRNDRFKQCNVYLMTPGVSAQDPARKVAAVAASAIGVGQASRLHWALVHPGLAEEAGLGHDEEDQAGSYAGLIVCEPERAQQCLDIYRQELAKVQSEGLDADEVKRAVRRWLTGVVLQCESPLSRLVQVGFDWVYRGEVTPLEDLVAELEQLSAEACNELLARRPFDQLTAVCVGPIDSLS